MSKVCIIGASNIKHISLISLYTTYFDKNSLPYDLIYWDRYGIDENTTATNTYCYKNNSNKGKFSKLLDFLGFHRFIVNILKKNKYKTVITWQTTVGYLLFDQLLLRYKKHYIINVRDYVAENTVWGRFLIKKLVRNAGMVALSSEGFKEFLPKADYVIVNSINEELLSDVIVDYDKRHTPPYKIGFAGNCRYFRECYKLIDALANDERFELWYCGTNSKVLQEYAVSNGINNVFTRPDFRKDETLEIFSGFDMANSAFGNDAFDNRTLVPIRLYTALSMHIPVLANKNTQLSKEIETGSVGYIINTYEGLGDSLYEYLSALDKNTFEMACDLYMNKAKEQNKTFYEALSVLME